MERAVISRQAGYPLRLYNLASALSRKNIK
jgi:hypothetical protein